MNLDRVTAAIRPRRPWEAVDLGFLLVRANLRSVYALWLAVVPAAWAAIWIGMAHRPFWAIFLTLWIRPIFDPLVLAVLSRSLFGERTRLGQRLRLGLRWVALHSVWLLTLGRIDFSRSFTMPVYLLEGGGIFSSGKRVKSLGAHVRSTAVGLTFACWLIELCLFISLFALVEMVLPPPYDLGFDLRIETFFDGTGPLWFHLLVGAFWLVAASVMGPLYVGAGFALYLNGRTRLEGWDVEIAFRRLGRRVAAERSRKERPGGTRRARPGQAGSGSGSGAAACLAFLLAGSLFAAATGPAAAQPPTEVGETAREVSSTEVPRERAKETIEEVLERPEFGHSSVEAGWKLRFKWEPGPESDSETDLSWFPFGALDEILGILVWLAAVAVAAGLVYLLLRSGRPPRRAPGGKKRGGTKAAVPSTVAGLDIAADSLPDDIPAAALALVEAGRPVEALSVLYRGTLAAAVGSAAGGSGEGGAGREALDVRPSWTEQECLSRLKGLLAPGAAEYFELLTGAWLAGAYARRLPGAEELRELAVGWGRHFGSRRAEARV